MALTTLDPDTVPIIVDLQKGIIGLPAIHPIDDVTTGTGVGATARQVYEAGFNVTLALDAMSDMRPEAHDHRIRNVFPRFGETGTSQELIDLLLTRSA